MKLQRLRLEGDLPDSPRSDMYVFWCPGCNEHHTFNVGSSSRPNWTFNGNMERPTFSPSLLYPTKKPRCHLNLTDGKLTFHADCGHALVGQTVDLPDIPEGQQW